MKVADILKLKGDAVETIGPEALVSDAVRGLNGPPRIGALVVCPDARRRVAGMITERDIIRGLGRHGARMLTLPVREVMSVYVPHCAPADSITLVMQEMTRSRYRHLPVVEKGRLVGIVSIGDVVKHRLAEVELEAGVLRDIYLARH